MIMEKEAPNEPDQEDFTIQKELIFSNFDQLTLDEQDEIINTICTKNFDSHITTTI